MTGPLIHEVVVIGTEVAMGDVIAEVSRALGDGEEPVRWQVIHPVAGDTPVRLVLVVCDDVDLDAAAEEQASSFTRLAIMAIRRERTIAACPGHEWEFEFSADYLEGEQDAICRCGARRSDIS